MREGVLSLSPHPVGDSAGPHWGASALLRHWAGRQTTSDWASSPSSSISSCAATAGWSFCLLICVIETMTVPTSEGNAAVSAQGLALGHLIIQ